MQDDKRSIAVERHQINDQRNQQESAKDSAVVLPQVVNEKENIGTEKVGEIPLQSGQDVFETPPPAGERSPQDDKQSEPKLYSEEIKSDRATQVGKTPPQNEEKSCEKSSQSEEMDSKVLQLEGEIESERSSQTTDIGSELVAHSNFPNLDMLLPNVNEDQLHSVISYFEDDYPATIIPHYPTALEPYKPEPSIEAPGLPNLSIFDKDFETMLEHQSGTSLVNKSPEETIPPKDEQRDKTSLRKKIYQLPQLSVESETLPSSEMFGSGPDPDVEDLRNRSASSGDLSHLPVSPVSPNIKLSGESNYSNHSSHSSSGPMLKKPLNLTLDITLQPEKPKVNNSQVSRQHKV